MRKNLFPFIFTIIMAGALLAGCGTKQEVTDQTLNDVVAESTVTPEPTASSTDSDQPSQTEDSENGTSAEIVTPATTPTKVLAATATSTPVPTEGAVETPTEVPMAEPTVTQAVEPTATPTVAPTSTPISTATPKPTETPMPTATSTPVPPVEPTSVPEPTAIPTATATPKPTNTPVPTATSTPTPTPTPTEAPVHTHEYSSKVTKEATCTEEGVKTFTCVCGMEMESKTIEKADHTPGSWEITKKATCTTEGSKVRNCTVCGVEVDSTTIAKTEHKSSDWIVISEASCSANGSKHKICTVCNTELASETIASGGTHNYYWDGDNSTRTRKCSGCSYTGITEYCYNGAWGYYDDGAANTLWNHVNNQRNVTQYNVMDDWGNTIAIENVKSLISDSGLNAKAKDRATEAAINFDHGSNTDECLSWGYGNGDEVFYAWCNSYSHLRALTNPEYVYGGIAFFWYDSDGTGENLTPIAVLEMSR